jgi:hypothetical protein
MVYWVSWFRKEEGMNEEGFREYLKRSGRSKSAVERCVGFVFEFSRFLKEQRAGKELGAAGPEDLEAFVQWIEETSKKPAKTQLWGLGYYFDFISNAEMRALASELRQQRIKRVPFALNKFRGVNQEDAERMAGVGVVNVEQMLEAGRTPEARETLSAETGVSLEAILEFVKLSDLARLGGVKGIRARLYHDAGVDTLEKMAEWDAEEMRAMLTEFVERTGYDGIAPLPKEAANAVATAKRLPKVVEY